LDWEALLIAGLAFARLFRLKAGMLPALVAEQLLAAGKPFEALIFSS